MESFVKQSDVRTANVPSWDLNKACNPPRPPARVGTWNWNRTVSKTLHFFVPSFL